jgi:hypothetical protein
MSAYRWMHEALEQIATLCIDHPAKELARSTLALVDKYEEDTKRLLDDTRRARMDLLLDKSACGPHPE